MQGITQTYIVADIVCLSLTLTYTGSEI